MEILIVSNQYLLNSKRQVNGWQNKWENPLAQSANGVAIPVSQTWLPWEKLQHYRMWTYVSDS